MNNNDTKYFKFEHLPKDIQIEDIYNNPIKEIPKIIHHICPNDFKKWHISWLICYESWLKYYRKSYFVPHCKRVDSKYDIYDTREVKNKIV